MHLSPHLAFDGTCREALELYAGAFGGTIQTMLPYRGSPMADTVPAEWQDRIMHATLLVGPSILMGADSPPGEYRPPAGFAIAVAPTSVAEAHRVFAALADGGAALMPIAETFWAAAFGVVRDRFGVTWEINCEVAPASAIDQKRTP
jgi:PhnB protein